MWSTDDSDSSRRTRIPQGKWLRFAMSAALITVATAAVHAADRTSAQSSSPARKVVAVKATKENWSAAVESNATGMFAEGKSIFRFDTFGDEVFWTDTLRLHQ